MSLVPPPPSTKKSGPLHFSKEQNDFLLEALSKPAPPYIGQDDLGKTAPAPNVMRHQYRELTEIEKANLAMLKQKGEELHQLIASFGGARETSLALTKVEEAIMWATKKLTT